MFDVFFSPPRFIETFDKLPYKTGHETYVAHLKANHVQVLLKINKLYDELAV